ncbi:MAG TPA: DUF6499 domain-containing protein, partial [Sphingomicrobium sp.]|nr:DUF6499 domain-containing protein [Sphingomicrobium sp.]
MPPAEFLKTFDKPVMPRNWDMPDWRDEHAYEALKHAERPAFAWEWLRRRPDYRMAAFRWLRDRSRNRGWSADE